MANFYIPVGENYQYIERLVRAFIRIYLLTPSDKKIMINLNIKKISMLMII
jgi:hypothetical protein